MWYAVNVTRVVLPPAQTLETFGATTVRYTLISEQMDVVDKINVREGKVVSERPQIITPSHFADQMLEGFGEKARHYADWLRAHNEIGRILRYGLHFRKDEISQEVVSDTIETVTDRVVKRVREHDDPLSAVIVGADEMWEVSLLKFIVDYIEQSASSNIRDLNQRAREESINEPQRRKREIEEDFRRAMKDRSHVQALGDKLHKWGLFEQYEDRFFNLVNRIQ